MKSIKKLIIAVMVVTSTHLYVSDSVAHFDFSELVKQVNNSKELTLSEKKKRIGQLLLDNIQKQRGELAKLGSGSKKDHPEFFELLEAVGKDATTYLDSNASQAEQIAAAESVLATSLEFHSKQVVKDEKARNAHIARNINAYSNVLHKLTIQSPIAQVSQQGTPKIEVAATRQERRDAQKVAAKLEKKAAKASQNK